MLNLWVLGELEQVPVWGNDTLVPGQQPGSSRGVWAVWAGTRFVPTGPRAGRSCRSVC